MAVLLSIALLPSACKETRRSEPARVAGRAPEKPKEAGRADEFQNFSLDGASQPAHIIDELDYLVLFLSLTKQPVDPEQFDAYYPALAKATNEFEKRAIATNVITELTKRKEHLLGGTYALGAKIDNVRIGEYDFRQQGFPVAGDYRYAAILEDNSRGARAFLNLMRSILRGTDPLAERYRIIGSVEFTNASNTALFPRFLPVPEKSAEKVVDEFSREENAIESVVSEALGQEHKGHRVATCYTFFRPTAAKTGHLPIGGQTWAMKEVHGVAFATIITTGKNTFLWTSGGKGGRNTGQPAGFVSRDTGSGARVNQSNPERQGTERTVRPTEGPAGSSTGLWSQDDGVSTDDSQGGSRSVGDVAALVLDDKTKPSEAAELAHTTFKALGRKSERTLASAANTRGYRLYQAGRLDDSLVLFQAAASIDTTYGMPRYNSARVYATKGDVENCVKYLLELKRMGRAQRDRLNHATKEEAFKSVWDDSRFRTLFDEKASGGIQ